MIKIKRIGVCFACPRLSAHDVHQPILELRRAKRLGKVLVSPEHPEPMLFAVVVGIATAQNHHWDIGPKAATAKVEEQRCAIKHWHGRVGDDDVGHNAFTKPAHGFEAIFGPHHIKFFGKEIANNPAKTIVVFYEE